VNILKDELKNEIIDDLDALDFSKVTIFFKRLNRKKFREL